VQLHRSQKIEELITFLSREHAQTKPDTTFTLSVISGTSVLALTRFSERGRSTPHRGRYQSTWTP